MKDSINIKEEDLKNGGRLFELFWLRPKNYAGKEVPLRIRINKKWGGWKVKDELVSSVGLEVGDTISTEITPFFTTGMIDDDAGTDLFASAQGADWLLNNNVKVGSIVDCFVRFSYSSAPVGPNGKDVSLISLVFLQGIAVVGVDNDYCAKDKQKSSDFSDVLKHLLS